MENAGKMCWLDVLDFHSRESEVIVMEGADSDEHTEGVGTYPHCSLLFPFLTATV